VTICGISPGMPALLPSRETNSVVVLSAYAVASLGRMRNRWSERVQGQKTWRSGSDPSRSARTEPALKMPLAEATCVLQLVGRAALEAMGPPTVGFNARSELPTDPTALSGASVGRTSVATRIS
jgi:hypothetical protein